MTKELTNQKIQTRRSFIKGVGGLSAALTATAFSTELLARNPQQNNNFNSKCQFSKLATKFIYLNSGTEGSMPDCVINELANKQNQWAEDPTTSYELDKSLGKHQHLNREKVAEFFSVTKNNITLTDNTTMGLSMAIMGLNFSSTDKVIVTNHEHNAIVSPLAILQTRLGLTVKTRNFPSTTKLSKMGEADLFEFLFPDTDELRGAKALCVSHVYPTTGARLSLKTLRKKADELSIQYLIVDGAQAFGMLDLGQGTEKITHTDFYACPGHKWLNGPPSTGILYIKNSKISPPEFYPTLSQRMSKYILEGKIIETDFSMAEALQVRGCSNTPGFSAMLSAISFVKELGGTNAIEKRILLLSNIVKDFITSRSPKSLVSPFKAETLLSGLTVFFPFSWENPDKLFYDKKTADRIVRKLMENNIQIRSIGFEDVSDQTKKRYALRISTGIFNSSEQLNIFRERLKEVLMSI